MFALTLIVLSLTACGGNYQSGDFTRDYQQALRDHPGVPVQNEWVKHFTQTYGNFTGEDFGRRLRELYAQQLFFNDTLHTHDKRNELVQYLEETSKRLDGMSLEIRDARISGHDLYLRWIMQTDFQVAFQQVQAKTIGMSHLRFNEDGQVVLHQDFWDSRQGVFEHIPVVGGVVKWLRSGL